MSSGRFGPTGSNPNIHDIFLQWDQWLDKPHDPNAWEERAIPSYLKNAEYQLDENERKYSHALANTQLAQSLVNAIPAIGPLLSGIFNIPLSVINKQIVENTNRRNEYNARYADWYNSPRMQMRRARAAGINPFMQGYVKSYPANIPNISAYQAPYKQSTPAEVSNALNNLALGSARISNLSSLTDINDYKLNNLLPQLFDRNGYLNSIYSLQAAWEEGNYFYERQLKQNILDISYKNSLAQFAENVMLLAPNVEDGRVQVNPESGSITYLSGDKEIDLTDLPLSQWPVFLQTAYTNNLSKQNLTSAQVNYYLSQANTSSALGALYNANAERVNIEVKSYKDTGIWATDDPVLRAAAGLTDWKYIWEQEGVKAASTLFDAGVNVGASYLKPSKGVKIPAPTPSTTPPVINKPQELRIPRGARPYTLHGQPYYYYK